MKDKTEVSGKPETNSQETTAILKKKKSLIIQFSRRLALIVIAMFGLLGWLSFRSASKGAADNYRETMGSMIPLFANTVSMWNQQFLREVSVYSQSDALKTGDEATILAWLQRIRTRKSKDFDYVYFCGPDGIEHVDTGQTTNIKNSDFYKAIMEDGKNEYITNPEPSKINGEMVYHICIAAHNDEQEKIGFFAGVVTLRHLQEMVNKITIGDNGYLFVLDGNGIVIAHPDNNRLQKKLADKQETGLTALAKEMLNRQTGNLSVLDSKQERTSVFYAPVADTSWSVGAVVPDGQINKSANQLGKSVAILCLVFGIVLVFLTGLMILFALKPLKGVEQAISRIASGNADLTMRISETVNNEIGSVVIGFNQFVAKLQIIIRGVKESKSDLSTAGEDLQASIEDTASAITQILSDIDSVNGEIANQSSSVEETAGAVTEISQNIVSLEKMIENQASGITESSAAVEQLIGNIGSVNQSVEKMATSFTELEEHATVGMSKQESVGEQIKQISAQSEMLEDANSAIANIAGQTNFLAMNAAIEAAHAGDAGRGFSVVADEIRKLSETSTAQSKTIGEELKKIQNSIKTVVEASTDTNAAFSSVSEKIKETDTLVVQIKEAMSEQLNGSKQIGEALRMMNDSTSEVRTASTEMSTGQKAILEEVSLLQKATSSMKGKVTEMSQGAKKINETGTALDGISKKVRTSIDQIGVQIDQFKV